MVGLGMGPTGLLLGLYLGPTVQAEALAHPVLTSGKSCCPQTWALHLQTQCPWASAALAGDSAMSSWQALLQPSVMKTSGCSYLTLGNLVPKLVVPTQ